MALNEAYRIAAPAQLAQELAQVEAQLAAAQPAQTVPAQELLQAQRAALQEAAPLGPFAPQGSGGTPGAGYAPSAVCTPQAPRRKKRGWKIALAVGLPLVLLGGGFLGYSLYAWNEIETAQAYEQYTQAYEWYERAPWLWELDEQRGQYTAAWVLVERGELSEAAQAFRELGDYADSGENVEKGGLPAARRPENTDKFPFSNRQIERVKHTLSLIGKGQIPRLKFRHADILLPKPFLHLCLLFALGPCSTLFSHPAHSAPRAQKHCPPPLPKTHRAKKLDAGQGAA